MHTMCVRELLDPDCSQWQESKTVNSEQESSL